MLGLITMTSPSASPCFYCGKYVKHDDEGVGVMYWPVLYSEFDLDLRYFHKVCAIEYVGRKTMRKLNGRKLDGQNK